MGRLEGKTAVVSGAGQGIGAATTEAFIREGAAVVWALDRVGDRLARFDDSRIRPLAVDVTDAVAVAEFALEAGRVDVLFNCAGIVPHGNVLDCSLDEWHEAFDVNVTSMYLMIRSLLPGMLEGGGGSIVNMASVISSEAAAPNRLAYGASKAAVIGLTKSVAVDFVGRGVRCNAVAPGTVDTPSFRDRASGGPDPKATLAAFIERQPMGRLGDAGEIAALVVHLASDESAFTTGSVYVTDGGMSL
jgi:2-keto-3-deoxy-L-fuconate dehydrogenase